MTVLQLSHAEGHSNSTLLPVRHTWSSMSANKPSSSICCSCSSDNLSPNLLGRFLQAQPVSPAGRLAIQTSSKVLQAPQVLSTAWERAAIAPAGGACTLQLLGPAEPYISRQGAHLTNIILHNQRRSKVSPPWTVQPKASQAK